MASRSSRGLRFILGSVCRSYRSVLPTGTRTASPPIAFSTFHAFSYEFHHFNLFRGNLPWVLPSAGAAAFHSLTDVRYPKRRPSDKPRRKRASLRPPGSLSFIIGRKISKMQDFLLLLFVLSLEI